MRLCAKNLRLDSASISTASKESMRELLLRFVVGESEEEGER